MSPSKLSGILFPVVVLASGLTAQDEKKPSLNSLLKTFKNEFVLIEPGEKKFPQKLVAVNPNTKKEIGIGLTDDFYVAKYEVPQNLWREVMGSNPSRWKGERNSVEMMTMGQAVEFCDKVTRLLREAKLISDKQVVRLPTELEWEYVASAGTTTKYYFGNDTRELDNHAWHTGNAAGNDPPVGAKKPNPWGLYDIHGYLWEFTVDSWQGDKPQVHLSPKDWPSKTKKAILKGGSWKDPAAKLATRFRQKAANQLKDDAVGLRCILTR